MTSSPPAEAPRFRGKTLTPESPVPLHIPEPANIPVLQNQIDPIFNLMSTHIESQFPPSNLTMMSANTSLHQPSNVASDNPVLQPVDTGVVSEGILQDHHDSDSDGDDDYIMAFEAEEPQEQSGRQSNDTIQNLQSSSTLQPSTTTAAYETSLPLGQIDPTLLPSGQSQDASEIPSQRKSDPLEPPQEPLISLGPETTAFNVSEENKLDLRNVDSDVNDGGVNYQTLLDNLSPAVATAPSAENISSTTTTGQLENTDAPRPNSAEPNLAALPIPAGLPPRPPPQEKPAIHPNYTPGEDIRTYHYPHTQTSTSHPSYTTQSSNSYRPSQGYPPPTSSTGVGANGLPPPPIATFQQPPPKASQSQRSPLTPQSRQKNGVAKDGESPTDPANEDGDDAPWPLEVERKYTQFLHDEAVYVAEGLWDRFPQGSRLFVGNLYTERVTKRDLFLVFHKYGRLAQVSIKNAYGFIQYLDSNCCMRALQTEQGQAIRGRKMHLEISKPQKNARNAAATAAGDSLRAGYGRRSRSPDHGRGSQRTAGQRSAGDRYDRGGPSNGFRDEPRRRDDYRPARSPSPRFRGRDEYRGGRDRSPDHYFSARRSRSRSPYDRHGRYRSRSPRGRDLDDEANLPLLRRDPRDVPDVQLIIVDEVDRVFVAYIEKSFRDRGLRCESLKLPRVSLTAVVKRQIFEGVQAVVKIFRDAQVTGKIPLQVFDRRGGVDNVRFEEYDELDAHIAAELVVRSKNLHLAPTPTPASISNPSLAPVPGPGPYGPTPAYGQAQYAQNSQAMAPAQAQPASGAPNLANLITSMDGPALQKLLSAMTSNPQNPSNSQPQTPQQPGQVSDLATLLSSVTRQQTQPSGFPYTTPQQQQPSQPNPYPASTLNPAFVNSQALSALLSNVNGRASGQNMAGQQQQQQQHQQMQPVQQQQVQNIMEQLARWKQ